MKILEKKILEYFPSQEEIDRLSKFKLYTENYRGKIIYINKPIPMRTKFYRNKDLATFHLKKKASDNGYNALINVRWDYIQREESTPKGGVYYYKEWSAYGEAIKM